MHQAVLADTAELYRVEASLKLDQNGARAWDNI